MEQWQQLREKIKQDLKKFKEEIYISPYASHINVDKIKETFEITDEN